MRTSQDGIDLIKHFEGFRPELYTCQGGKPTIGYGHVLRPGEAYPDGITEAEAEELLRRDVGWAERCIERCVEVELTQGQFDALVSLVFNIGGVAFSCSTLRDRLNRGDYSAAAEEFGRWVYAGGRKQTGLIRRRAAERALFEGQDWREA